MVPLSEIISKTKSIVEKDKELDETSVPIREKIEKKAKSTRFSGNLLKLGFDKSEAIHTKVDVFPPCIQELIQTLQSKGHLTHAENWQLGTYLKRVGMSIEEQQLFWYENSIDNYGLTFEQFKKRVNYQILHIYGKVGGEVDYNPPSCKKCISDYYCYWAHSRSSDIIERIRDQFKEKPLEELEKAIDEISHYLNTRRFQKACARYFTLLTGWTIKGYQINHLISFTRQAYKKFYGKNEKAVNMIEEDDDE